MMGDIFSYLYQFADVFAFLILSAAGLAIVFGMMGVINMAHGEFIMCGAYVTVGLVDTGFPLIAAQLCGAIVAGLIGVLIEVVIVRRFYKRPEDSLLATWGLSLIVTQGTLLVIGSTVTGIGTPPGSFTVGEYSFSTYRLILFGASIAVLAFIYFVFMRTKFRRDGPRDDAGCRRRRARSASRSAGSMRSLSASAPASRACAAGFMRRR